MIIKPKIRGKPKKIHESEEPPTSFEKSIEFGILLSSKRSIDSIQVLVRMMKSGVPCWFDLSKPNLKISVNFNFPRIDLESIRNLEAKEFTSLNTELTTVINSFLHSYYSRHLRASQKGHHDSNKKDHLSLLHYGQSDQKNHPETSSFLPEHTKHTHSDK